MNTDVVIIGAGPAGVFTALEMIRTGSHPKPVMVEKGQAVENLRCPKSKTGRCVNCKPYCHITNGFSGLTAGYPVLFGVKLSREGTFILLTVVLVLVMMLTHNLVNGQMGMYELLKNDWTQPEPWRLSAAAQEKQPEPSAEAEKPEPAKTEAAPAAKQAEASHPESAAAPESGDRFDQLEQMVNHKKRTEPQLAPAAKPIKPVVVETPAPRSRLKRILDFFRLRR